jgi:required for meiotic nuclear division protein 1
MPIRPDFKARAILVADRIDVRAWKSEERLASNPLAVSVPGGGMAVLFRYGVVVFFDTTTAEESAFFGQIGPLMGGAFPAPETEEVEISIASKVREGMHGDKVFLASDELERLQVVADILSKSVMLAWYEGRIAGVFEMTEPLATELRQTGRISARERDLSRQIGAMLQSQHLMTGGVEVDDKPELLWERPELEGLFIRLEDEFELKERHALLGRKLNLISQTAQTLLQLQQGRHSLRLELYIVVLIVVEIALMLYEMFLAGH